ncbi:alpha-amylase family glycosyl hydrolase [Shigella flexneri]
MTQRLDYLQRLGVDAIWLTPFYISRRLITVTTRVTIPVCRSSLRYAGRFLTN